MAIVNEMVAVFWNYTVKIQIIRSPRYRDLALPFIVPLHFRFEPSWIGAHKTRGCADRKPQCFFLVRSNTRAPQDWLTQQEDIDVRAAEIGDKLVHRSRKILDRIGISSRSRHFRVAQQLGSQTGQVFAVPLQSTTLFSIPRS